MESELVGKQIGNYRVEALLGKGGMGAVYSGVHRFFGERVAIKILHGQYADDPVIAERFFREAQAARDINHPSIIAVKDFGQTEDGCLYLVMELLKGQTLGALLERGSVSEETAATVGAYIAEALAAAHAKGVVHRDLKPDNVFIVDGRIKLLDFGIAKVTTAGKLTETGALMGTPRYMSPEQVRGSKTLGPQSDLFSLGVILFEMVTGRPPFTAESVAVFVSILTEDPPPPSTLRSVSPEMDRLILQCMAKEPEARPSSALEVRERLARWAPLHAGNTLPKPIAALQALAGAGSDKDNPIDVMQLPALGSLARANRTMPPGEPPSEQPLMTAVRRRRRSGGSPIVFALFAALIAAGSVALVVLRHGHSTPQPEPVATAPANPPPIAAAAPASPEPVAAPAPAAPTAAPVMAVPAALPAHVALRSEPQGADILDATGRVIGHTPDSIQVTLPFKFTLRRVGYQPMSDVLVKPEDGERVFRLARVASNARSSTPLPAAPPPPEKRPLMPLD